MNGLLLIDKPTGCTSHDLVAKLRKKFNLKSVGHAGTLDPLATGLMIMLVGEATKISDYFLQGEKAYIVGARLGIRTDTDDITGNVVEESTQDVDSVSVLDRIEKLSGSLMLKVPIYSALKKSGKKLYEYARESKPVEVPQKEMIFYETKLLNQAGKELSCYLRCSKGSYVRSWVRELGIQLSTCATVSELRRVSSAPYNLDRALPWEHVMGSEDFSNLTASGAWIPLEKAMPHWPSYKTSGKDEHLFKNGAVPHYLERLFEVQFSQEDVGIKVISKRSGKLIGLVARDDKNPYKFKVKRVFAS